MKDINTKNRYALLKRNASFEVVKQIKRLPYYNKSLDVEFFSNVNGNYLSSKLFAQKAEYSNSKGFVVVSQDVKIIDKRGTMFAEKLLFDIKEETLKITSEKNEKIKANINLK